MEGLTSLQLLLSLCGILYNNVPYYFLGNLQGDVIAIVDKNAQTVARYSYDAWGVPTATQIAYGNIAEINPFRYRSYYYDEETSLYYLQSRYYDDNVGRFVNADEIIYIIIISNAPHTNLFLFCINTPVINCDYTGYWYYSLNDFYEQKVIPYNHWYIPEVIYLFQLDIYRNYQSQYNHNVEKCGNYYDYIYGQGNQPFADMQFASCKIKDVGCEIIAIYNIMKYLCYNIYFPDVINECYLNGLQWLSGHFGINPKTLHKYFDAHNIVYQQHDKFSNWISKICQGYPGIL